MATLLLRFAAPLQAWGSNSKFNIRTTEREPTKSGVIGMIAAAMGIKRCDDKGLERLSGLRFGVRVDREGKLVKDFHMVRQMKNGKLDDSHLTERYYLSDAVFLVALESEDTVLLEEIENALKSPVYPLFLGRRSCPPTLPLVLNVTEDTLETALRNTELLVENNGKHKEKYIRIICDCDNGGSVVQDVPVSFSQLRRKHGYRMKKEEFYEIPQPEINEHDPMAEL